ncbi:MAG: cell-cycle regulation histidine triad protein [Paenibacillus sp.]|nr:cell-cycle regulation histidine triad protein [Paenibacillus sp.]
MNECPFCRLTDDRAQQVIFENEYCLFIQKESEQDVLEGCGLIIPRAHKEDVFRLSQEEWNATYELLQRVKAYLDVLHTPDGYTLGWNVGKASNQHIGHAHFHIIPRYMDEPHAGKGIRYWIKQPDNKRPKRLNGL